MKDRRPLIAGISSPSSDVAELEKQFVYGGRPEVKTEELPETPAPHQESPEPSTTANVPADRAAPVITGRVPITTRVRPEVASALKQASLKRQLAGVEPSFVQDIMEEALEMWLKAKGAL